MFRTKLRRALFVWGILSIVAGIAIAYGTGERVLHPTDRFYHLEFGIPIGLPYPWFTTNVGARQTYDRLTNTANPTVHYRKVVMFVPGLDREALMAQRKPFEDAVDSDYRQYWIGHADRMICAMVYAFAMWAGVAGSIATIRWVMRA